MTPITPPAPSRWTAFWALLHEPPVVTAAATLAYLALMVFGALSFFYPPSPIKSELGVFATVAWSCFASLGGVLGLLAAPRGIWWLERVAIYSVTTFLAIYSVTIVNLQVTATGSRWMQLGVLSLGWYFIVSRWDRTRGAALDPTRGFKEAKK